MGASGAFMKNAQALGVDLEACHWAFLSHAHADHTGGLGKWIAQHGHIPVYASHRIATDEYFSSRPKKVASMGSETDSPISRLVDSPERSDLRYIGADLNLFHGHTPWFKPIEQNTWLTPHIALVHPTCNLYPKPLGNKYLTVVEGQSTTSTTKRLNTNSPNHRITASPSRSENDPFLHEIALCFVTSKGLVIISCCSHHGALNTIASCMEFTGCNTLHAYIGGLHFVDSPQVEAETTSFIGDWLTLYPNAHLYTGHCTCPRAATMLKALIPHCHTFYTGKVVEV
jgi:7,8-dihydropterin-6-yl-methyl-4-(beta-D-ribofuranosyl)aminobenzene 5'-phosphate synthase